MDKEEHGQKISLQDLIKDAYEFVLRCRAVTEEEAEEFEHQEKVKLARVLYDVGDESKRILKLLNIYCSFCRQVGGRDLGECAQCKRPVCSLCGSLIDGKPLHSDICRLWYKRENK